MFSFGITIAEIVLTALVLPIDTSVASGVGTATGIVRVSDTLDVGVVTAGTGLARTSVKGALRVGSISSILPTASVGRSALEYVGRGRGVGDEFLELPVLFPSRRSCVLVQAVSPACCLWW